MKDVSPGNEVADERLRSIFMKSGFNVTVPEEASEYARLIRALYVEFEDRPRKRETRRAWLIALVGVLVPIVATILLHMFKVI